MERSGPLRVETVLGDIHGMKGKNLQLWSMNLVVIVALTVGFLALILPKVFWNLATLRLAVDFVSISEQVTR